MAYGPTYFKRCSFFLPAMAPCRPASVGGQSRRRRGSGIYCEHRNSSTNQVTDIVMEWVLLSLSLSFSLSLPRLSCYPYSFRCQIVFVRLWFSLPPPTFLSPIFLYLASPSSSCSFSTLAFLAFYFARYPFPITQHIPD